MTPFVPGSTTTVSVTNTTGTTILKGPPNPSSVRLYNAGSALVFFRAGGSDVVATTGDTPLPAGAIEVFDLTSSAGRNGFTHIAAITPSSTATLYVTCGQGM